MAKKRIGAVIMLGIFLSVFAFTGCDGFNLAEYKETAKATIQTYALEKGLNNEYSEENWAKIESIVAQGESTVDAANNKPAVDTAVITAKLAIDEVESKLSEELRDQIKADYLNEFGHEFCFDRFYGLYKGAAVFFIQGVQDWVKVVTISGIEFGHTNGWTILVWKDGVFYNLENIEPIFEAGILTQGDLEQIGIIHAQANAKEGKMDVNFTLSLGRMDYGSATNIETIVNSINDWTALDAIASLPELSDKYSESFFADNALIVFALGRGTRGAQFEKVEVFGQNGDLMVKVFDDGCGYMDMVSNWVVVLEVKKADISSFSNLHLETNFYSYNQ